MQLLTSFHKSFKIEQHRQNSKVKSCNSLGFFHIHCSNMVELVEIFLVENILLLINFMDNKYFQFGKFCYFICLNICYWMLPLPCSYFTTYEKQHWDLPSSGKVVAVRVHGKYFHFSFFLECNFMKHRANISQEADKGRNQQKCKIQIYIYIKFIDIY